MTTLFEHTKSNILVIPQALFAMKDVEIIAQHRNSIICIKRLLKDLTDVEFYTNTPCFIYIEHGEETLWHEEMGTVKLSAGASVFLPQGLNLQSNFVKHTASLRAYLVFFDDEVINNYLKGSKSLNVDNTASNSYLHLEHTPCFTRFFESLNPTICASAYLHAKLTELLYLIEHLDRQGQFRALISSTKRTRPKQNLQKLLSSTEVIFLSVSDLAHLSGRSLSSFNRDFKKEYNTTPKKWLQSKKLSKAKQLLESSEYSVTQVALEVGFDNVSNFIKVFKTEYGTTPKKFTK